MSGLEVIGAVAAVVSAFHGGAELVGRIKEKRRRRSKKQTQQDFEEQQLQDSLTTGESKVANRFASDVQELGEIVRVGDAIARDRLLHIAVVMQAQIIKSLQIAVEYENAVVNLSMLYEASILNRQHTIDTLDGLKRRILIVRPPLPRPLPAQSSDSRRFSVETIQSYRPASIPSVSGSDIPPAVTFTDSEDPNESKSMLTRYFMKRDNTQSSGSSQEQPTAQPGNTKFLPNVIMSGEAHAAVLKDIDDMIENYRELNTSGNRRDTWAALNNGGPSSGGSHSRHYIPTIGNLPPTPEDTHDPSGYSGYHGAGHQQYTQHHTPAQWTAQSGPQEQNARWTAPSSAYSDTVPPALYSPGSRSSYDSAIGPDQDPRASTGVPKHPYPTQNGYLAGGPSATHPYGPNPPLTPPQAPLAVNKRSSIPVDPANALPNAAQMQAPSFAQQDPVAASIAQGNATVGSNAPPTPTQPQYAPRLPPSKPLQHTTSTSTTSSSHTAGSIQSLSIRQNTIASLPGSRDTMMSGRPCRDNNYWGFCKGAWAVREELKRGLSLTTRPDGMYNRYQIWECKHCHFAGNVVTAPHPTKKKKFETIVDPTVRVSTAGVRYKWIFLAKSHVKKKAMGEVQGGRTSVAVTSSGSKAKGSGVAEAKEECNYGCVICSVEGNVTGIYGNVETLMNHIYQEHSRDMGEKVAAKSRCVVGRVAGAGEDWDLNIPVRSV